MRRHKRAPGGSSARPAVDRKCRLPLRQILLIGSGLMLLSAAAWWLLVDTQRDEAVRITGPPPQAGATQTRSGADAAAEEERLAVPSSAVTQRACAECHETIVSDFRRSGMSRTWRSAADVDWGDRPFGSPVKDTLTGYEYRVLLDKGALFQLETRRDDRAHELRRRADYVVGSGKHAEAMVTATNGYLNLLPVGWFRTQQAWGMNPGFELKNHRFDRPINTGCIACHGTSAAHQVPTRNRFHLPIPEGIDCSRCHGSADGHVAYWQRGGLGEQPPDAKLIDPNGFTAAQQNDLCFQCHLQGDVTLYLAGKDPWQFRPGDRLRDHRHDLLISTEDAASLGVASHGARMLRSRCYTASHGQLTCIGCHDPHQAVEDVPREMYDRHCATCHTAESCSRPAIGGLSEPPEDPVHERGKAPAPAESSCVACHMPQRSSREGNHLVFTDHSIPRHAPDPARPPAKPPLLAPDAAVELVSCWPGESLEPAVLGAAYQLLHETMGPQRPSLDRGCKLLQEALAKSPDDSEIQFWLGSAWLSQGNGPEAIALLRQVVRAQPQRYLARYRLGLACELEGRPAEAAELYDRLLREVPAWLETYPRLAQIYLAQQQPDQAARVLEQQLAQRDDATAFAQLGLVHRLRGGDSAQAQSYIHRSLQLDPLLPTAYLNRAVLALLDGNSDQALADFQQVLRLDPGNLQARQAITELEKRRAK